MPSRCNPLFGLLLCSLLLIGCKKNIDSKVQNITANEQTKILLSKRWLDSTLEGQKIKGFSFKDSEEIKQLTIDWSRARVKYYTDYEFVELPVLTSGKKIGENLIEQNIIIVFQFDM